MPMPWRRLTCILTPFATKLQSHLRKSNSWLTQTDSSAHTRPFGSVLYFHTVVVASWCVATHFRCWISIRLFTYFSEAKDALWIIWCVNYDENAFVDLGCIDADNALSILPWERRRSSTNIPNLNQTIHQYHPKSNLFYIRCYLFYYRLIWFAISAPVFDNTTQQTLLLVVLFSWPVFPITAADFFEWQCMSSLSSKLYSTWDISYFYCGILVVQKCLRIYWKGELFWSKMMHV